MATPNYGYEKRQKELAKKRKKEDKLRAKADRKSGISEEGDAGAVEDSGGAELTQQPQPPAPAG